MDGPLVVECHITPNLTFEEFKAILRRDIGGMGDNREEYKMVLRRTRI